MEHTPLSAPHYHCNLLIDNAEYYIMIRIVTGNGLHEYVPSHYHSEYELLAFADGGTVIHADNKPQLMLNGGQCCVIAPKGLHRHTVHSDTTKYYTISIRVPKGTTLQLPKNYLLHCAPELFPLLQALEKELTTQVFGSQQIIQALSHMILVTILRELCVHKENTTSSLPSFAIRYEDAIIDYIAMHYSEDIRIGQVAETLGVTPRHLTRLMQQIFNCTFRQLLTIHRLSHAKILLTSTDLSIVQIAMACGFANESSFGVVFRKSIGCTPSQYRRQNKPKG